MTLVKIHLLSANGMKINIEKFKELFTNNEILQLSYL